LVSLVGLGSASLLSEAPAGVTPPEAPLVDAPQVDPVEPDVAAPDTDGQVGDAPTDPSANDAPSIPVGSLTIQKPQAPALPEGQLGLTNQSAPAVTDVEPDAPRAYTDPLNEPSVFAIEGTMQAPKTSDASGIAAQPIAPVLPNPQAQAPQTLVTEADLSISTAPAQPEAVVIEGTDAPTTVDDPAQPDATPNEDFFVVDLGSDAVSDDAVAPDTTSDAVDTTIAPTENQPEPEAADEVPDTASDTGADIVEVPTEQPEDDILVSTAPETAAPRLQLQGAGNVLPGNNVTGVTNRRPTPAQDEAPDVAIPAGGDALVDFSAQVADAGDTPLMSFVLIDDGSMSAAFAALAGLPFPVTIALDAASPDAAEMMTSCRAAGFEVAVLAKLPEGASPTDVEVTFDSVFAALPETIAVLDVGDSGLQLDRAVTKQAMDILASQGCGFVTVSQGLNMAGRAAEQAGVPAVVVYRDLDIENQDARVVRRSVDQAAFRARQDSGVVLVGRMRPDTISALILWGTANQDGQVAIVPVSSVLTAQ
jgi:polysaccharide deacetylase 2 family uncharacterized protein YibQ